MVARLGDPPARLPSDPPTCTWTAGQAKVRVYHEHPDRDPLAPRTCGPVARLDPHVRDRHQQPRIDPGGRGAVYLADDLATALAEVFEQWPEVRICPQTRAVWARPAADVPLLDLTGDGALAIGAVGTLVWGDEPRRRTQRWARRAYEHYPHLAGIRYHAAHQGGGAVVLWERAPRVHPAQGGDRASWTVWSRVRVALAGQGRRPQRITAEGCPRCETSRL